jgi:hypothetical protein
VTWRTYEYITHLRGFAVAAVLSPKVKVCGLGSGGGGGRLRAGGGGGGGGGGDRDKEDGAGDGGMGRGVYSRMRLPTSTMSAMPQPKETHTMRVALRSSSHVSRSWSAVAAAPVVLATSSQGLTLVHFSAQLEPCLTHKNILHTLNIP